MHPTGEIGRLAYQGRHVRRLHEIKARLELRLLAGAGVEQLLPRPAAAARVPLRRVHRPITQAQGVCRRQRTEKKVEKPVTQERISVRVGALWLYTGFGRPSKSRACAGATRRDDRIRTRAAAL